eukprot:gnl/TRDRNA2_/TRDRNA2_85917_c0_seq3.p1 gnl/TRDRNA2_/TRDRNA2_85917_c0~~gnl/TRDRNA2_/TRDRNA2_85917_c0_seq3.p1  ORF type:complete len:581 (+),score=46.92 gnl/TRDRNA2_/TRDRNA2_85917_c0_seq3:179-1921(+)
MRLHKERTESLLRPLFHGYMLLLSFLLLLPSLCLGDVYLQPIDMPILSSLEVVLSTKSRAPLAWEFGRVTYSITVPFEAVAAAIVATVRSEIAPDTILRLHRPDEGAMNEDLMSGIASTFADVPTEESARSVLEVLYGGMGTNYTVLVLRSTISSTYRLTYPDRAEGIPPSGTLTGLAVYDMFGLPARMESFLPQRSTYFAPVDVENPWVFCVASQNDPDGSLELRINGQAWNPLTAGRNSEVFSVPTQSWLLIEVKVMSATAAAAGFAPLIYTVVVTRDVICHERCRTCFGPGEEHCISCRAPLVLFNGRCDASACPPDGYYEWESYQCRRCHETCAQCSGPGADACTLCPALHFLMPESYYDKNGACTIQCPLGKFAHPPSRRCRRPPTASVRTFYLKFIFRIAPAEFQANTNLQEMVLNTTAFVLGVSLSDVRSYQIGTGGAKLMITVEVVSPWITKAEADVVPIDTWFGAFAIPMDEIESMTWDTVHPVLPPLPIEPFLPSWAWGLCVSAALAVLVLFPMYCCYFRRLANTRKVYVTRIDPVFVDRVVTQSPSWLIRRFIALDSGSKNQGQVTNLN